MSEPLRWACRTRGPEKTPAINVAFDVLMCSIAIGGALVILKTTWYLLFVANWSNLP